jgi:ribonuclease J
MIRNMEIAERLGLLTAPRGTIVSMDEASRLAPHKVVLITTGTQGEPMAALSRMARREHRQITVRPGDLIVLSSSLVPGNEEAVFGVINMLSQIGATVITGKDAMVHTSGHGYSGELLFLYNAARPKQRHAGARRVAPPARQPRAGDLHRCEPVTTRSWRRTVSSSTSSTATPRSSGRFRSATSTSTASPWATSEPRSSRTAPQMSEGGLISVTVVIDNRSGSSAGGPAGRGQGLLGGLEGDDEAGR